MMLSDNSVGVIWEMSMPHMLIYDDWFVFVVETYEMSTTTEATHCISVLCVVSGMMIYSA